MAAPRPAAIIAALLVFHTAIVSGSSCNGSVRGAEYIRCDADAEYYWCECDHCTLHRTCPSDPTLYSCACPPGTVDLSGTLWVETPFSARWWKRFTYLDPLLGFFGGIVFFVSCGGCLIAADCTRSIIRQNQLEPGASPCKGIAPSVGGMLIAGAVSCGAMALLLGSGPAALAIAIGVPLCCCCRIWLKQQKARRLEERVVADEEWVPQLGDRAVELGDRAAAGQTGHRALEEGASGPARSLSRQFSASMRVMVTGGMPPSIVVEATPVQETAANRDTVPVIGIVDCAVPIQEPAGID